MYLIDYIDIYSTKGPTVLHSCIVQILPSIDGIFYGGICQISLEKRLFEVES